MAYTHSDHPRPDGRRVAVIHNPTKHADQDAFVQLVTDYASHHGWQPPINLPTSESDPGEQMTRDALDASVDLVLAAGGDGTVRVVTNVLKGTGVPCAIIPIGTGNLLARNLGVPLDVEGALELAFTGGPRTIDVASVVVDHDATNVTGFTGMAGVGFDAAMMRDTDERVKKVAGNVAYAVAFAKQLGTPPRKVRVQVDDGPVLQRKAVLMLVGNTSQLQAGIELFPDAVPDDGMLNMLLAAPITLGMWARLLRAVLRRRHRHGGVEYLAGKKFVLALDEQVVWELDGDAAGEGSHFEFTVEPGALQVIAPDA